MKAIRFLLALLLVVSAVSPAATQSPQPGQKVDIGSFVKELMLLRFQEKEKTFAIWIPFEFFVEAAILQTGGSRAETERQMEFLRPYQPIVVQSSISDAAGTDTYATEAEVRSRAVLKLDNGAEIKPLDKVPPLVAATVAALKAVIEAEAGGGKTSMHILMFPATSNNAPIIDTAKKGKLTLLLKADARFKQSSFVWRTPFDATSPGTMCPRCKETVSAKWSYCPWCGAGIEKK